MGGVLGFVLCEYDIDMFKYIYIGVGGVLIGNWFNCMVFVIKFV